MHVLALYLTAKAEQVAGEFHGKIIIIMYLKITL